MQHPVPVGEIKTRATAVNLTLKKLARRSGLSPSTAYRGARGEGESRKSTEKKLTDTLVAEELRLRDHLLALHPIATEQGRDAA